MVYGTDFDRTGDPRARSREKAKNDGQTCHADPAESRGPNVSADHARRETVHAVHHEQVREPA
jgi:hypothetical protein